MRLRRKRYGAATAEYLRRCSARELFSSGVGSCEDPFLDAALSVKGRRRTKLVSMMGRLAATATGGGGWGGIGRWSGGWPAERVVHR